MSYINKDTQTRWNQPNTSHLIKSICFHITAQHLLKNKHHSKTEVTDSLQVYRYTLFSLYSSWPTDSGFYSGFYTNHRNTFVILLFFYFKKMQLLVFSPEIHNYVKPKNPPETGSGEKYRLAVPIFSLGLNLVFTQTAALRNTPFITLSNLSKNTGPWKVGVSWRVGGFDLAL